MKEEDKKDNRGGVRKGAGRPKSDSKLYAFRADGQMSRFIDNHDNKTEFIRSCINDAFVKESQSSLNSSPNGSSSIEHLGEVYPATRIKPFSMPLFDVKIVAGFPIPLDNDELAQDIELSKMLCPNPEASYLIRVQGDSMIGSGIFNGDIVIVDKSNRNPTEQEVAVCELNGEYTLKHLAMREGRGWLIPANPNYPEIEIMEGDDFSVWGTVTYVIHRPRS